MKKTILAALLASISATALASSYYIVVPVPARTATTGNILVALNPAALPSALAGRAYAGFDFNSVLQVKGDPSVIPGGVAWSVASGELPAGMTLSADGRLAGTPTAAGTSRFQLQASYKTKAGTQAYQVLVGEVAVALALAALPAGVQGAAYHQDLKPYLTVSGDPSFSPASVTWNFIGEQPPGLQLNTNGTITGIPTAEGTHPITVRATYLGRAGEQTYQVLVGAIQVTLSASAVPPAAAVFGQAYNAGKGWDLRSNLGVSGDAAYAGTGVTWSLVGGALPAGLALNANGTVSGTPSAAGANPVQVKAEYKGKSATQGYTIPFTAGIAQQPSFRAWSDGTFAAHCNEYRAGKPGYAYAGATGDGIYRIDVDGAGPLSPADVVCDMTTEGGGWTVFQRRANGSVDFYRTYAEYASGFGNTTEYWLGNDRLAALAGKGVELRIDMVRYTGETAYARYSNFVVNPAADGYRMAVTWVGGTAGDSFMGHSNHMFSTWDKDQDTAAWGNCAEQFKGAWWYTECHSSNLNGRYLNGPHESYADGVEWYAWTQHYESLTKTEMKIR